MATIIKCDRCGISKPESDKTWTKYFLINGNTTTQTHLDLCPDCKHGLKLWLQGL